LNRNDVVVGNWITTFGDPPRFKGLVGKNIKTLLRRWGFTESVRDIRSEDKFIFDSGEGIKNA
jgi:hypothetical protein